MDSTGRWNAMPPKASMPADLELPKDLSKRDDHTFPLPKERFQRSLL